MDAKERIEQLKERTFTTPELCTERAHFFKEAYEEYECEPMPIIRARALEKLAENCTINIFDGETLLGWMTGKQKAGALMPEIEWKWYMGEFWNNPNREEEKVKTTQDEMAYLAELLSFWKGKTLCEKWWAEAPDEYKNTKAVLWEQGGGTPTDGQHMAHCIPDYIRVLDRGANGIIEKVEKRIAELDLTDMEQLRQHTYLRAMKISLKALITFARRYSALAKEKAKKETDPERKAELEKIAEICYKVPAEPAENFYEALQAVWFVYCVIMLEGYGPGFGFGRMDQYMYKYYTNDLKEGTFTRDQLRDLIAEFYIKMNMTTAPSPIAVAGKAGGRAGIVLSPVNISGATPGSKFNLAEDLTMLFLEAEEEVMLQEDMVFFIHNTISDACLLKAVKVAKEVKGKIKFTSQETAILQQMHIGKNLDEACNVALTACFLHTVPGISHDVGGDFFNVATILELALNDGVFRKTGVQVGPHTGDPRTFKTYEDVWNAFMTQLATLLPHCIKGMALYMKMWSEIVPYPLLSALYDGCIEKGLDVCAGGTRYSSISVWCVGIPDVGDSLAALKKVVFEDKKLTMSQVMDAIDHDFEGYEDVRRLLEAAPKFGNDIDFADNIVNDVFVTVNDECMKYRCHGDRLFTGTGAAITTNISMGGCVAALPDGRKAGEPLSEGGISPCQGRNTSGATATLMSAAKLNFAKVAGGSVLNIKLNPDGWDDPAKLRALASMMRTYAMMGGDILQLNFVSNEMLRDAQAHPENYRDLLVRVATYSAYFVNLPKAVQDDIIARVELEV
jgi:formate C-acetyltransferase